MRFENFSIWRKNLPHWRADHVTYYVTFRHRRQLSDAERLVLFRQLLRSDGKKWDLSILCVLPDATELVFQVFQGPKGTYELSDIVEKAKTKAGKLIIKNTGERFPPFYTESYDRIIRDDPELEEHFQRILFSMVTLEFVEDPEQWETLWVKGIVN